MEHVGVWNTRATAASRLPVPEAVFHAPISSRREKQAHPTMLDSEPTEKELQLRHIGKSKWQIIVPNKRTRSACGIVYKLPILRLLYIKVTVRCFRGRTQALAISYWNSHLLSVMFILKRNYTPRAYMRRDRCQLRRTSCRGENSCRKDWKSAIWIAFLNR